MNGKVQGIIICGVVAASLAGVMAFLNSQEDSSDGTQPQPDTRSAAAAESVESVIILDKTADEVQSVKAVNANGGFTLDKPASGKTSWTVEELGTVSQNSILKENAVDVCGMLEAYKLVEENVSDLSKYGLETPQGSFEITYTDGTSQTVEIGDVSTQSRYNYVKLGDSDDVYMVLGSKLSYFLDPAGAYAELSLIAAPSSDDWPEYGIETVSRKDWDYDVTFENDPKGIEGMLSSQVISSPIFSYLNITGSSAVTHGMWGLIAAECVKAEPSEEDLAEYGLDDPVCTVRLEGDGYNYYLRVGSEAFDPDVPEGDNPVRLGYYCYLEGVSGRDAVYIIADSNLPWVSFRIEEVISNIMTTNYLVDLTEISVDVNGEKTVYEITSNGTSKDTADNGGAADVTAVTSGGQELDVYNFKGLYQYIMTCPTDELCFSEPDGESEITIVQTRYDGGSDTVELFKDTSRRYIVKLNGKTSFRIQSTWVDTLLKNMESIKNGGAADENY